MLIYSKPGVCPCIRDESVLQHYGKVLYTVCGTLDAIVDCCSG